MTRKVTISSLATEDLTTLLYYALSTGGAAAATALDAQIDGAIASLDRLAGRGRVVPELRARGIVTFRELIRGTYRIVYQLAHGEVRVVAIVDGRRDLDAVLYERARR